MVSLEPTRKRHRPAATNPLGRPTLYQPEYCPAVIEMGKQGKSPAYMASFFNIDRITLMRWAEAYPDFGTALSRAREHAQAWWEEDAQRNLGSKHYQSQLWRYNVMGRFKDDYGERQQVDVNVTLREALVASAPLTIEGEASCSPVVARDDGKATKAKDIKDIAAK